MSHSHAADISVYDRLWHSDEQLCALLATGAGRHELTAVFGAAEYRVLAALARRAQAVAPRHGAPVYILPGILGTQLGAPRAAPAPANLLWLDPQDIVGGALTRLRFPDAAGLITLGAIPHNYLALQLRLKAAGFTVVMHDYDWRMSLDDLGMSLAARLRGDPAAEISIIAHSMGGIIARRALAEAGLEHVRRVITLGAPHGGSYGAVQALRGTYPVVCRLAALDRSHDAGFLAANVFSTFPSIHQLLPSNASLRSADFFDADNWPLSGPRPNLALLQAARVFTAALPAPDTRCIAISGTHQRTVTSLRLVNDEFHYEVSDAGDGTVPLTCAQLSGCDNYFVRSEHSALPRSVAVARALVELLRHGRTTRLASRPGPHRGRHVTVSDSELRTALNPKIDWAQLAPAARRDYLNRLNRPPPQYAARRSSSRVGKMAVS